MKTIIHSLAAALCALGAITCLPEAEASTHIGIHIGGGCCPPPVYRPCPPPCGYVYGVPRYHCHPHPHCRPCPPPPCVHRHRYRPRPPHFHRAVRSCPPRRLGAPARPLGPPPRPLGPPHRPR